MKFGVTPLDQAEGGVLAHSVRLAGAVFKKGRVLSADDVAALRRAGRAQVVIARFDPDDRGLLEIRFRGARECGSEQQPQ